MLKGVWSTRMVHVKGVWSTRVRVRVRVVYIGGGVVQSVFEGL